VRVAFAYIGSEVLGIEFLSAILKRQGHQVRLFYDPSLFDDRAIFSLPSLHRLFDVRHQMVERLVDYDPDLVGFSVLTNTYRWALDVARSVKSRLTVPVIFGGVHPTVVPESVIAQDAVDMINIGEGFESLPELVARIEAGKDIHRIDNLWVKDNGTVHRNQVRHAFQDLDALPHPDKSVFAAYFDVGESYLTITGFGCPYHCTFCSNDLYLDLYGGKGRYIRRRSVKHVIDELRSAKSAHRIEVVKFADEIFTLNVRWLEEFSPAYRQEIGLPFIALAHPGHVNDKIGRLLAEAGCHRLEFGVQSVNEETKRQILNRPETKEELRKAFSICEQYGIRYMINHMFGVPTEDERHYREAVEFYSQFRPSRVGSFYLKYLPGTRINEIAVEHGVITRDDVNRFTSGYFATVHTDENIDGQQLKTFKCFETLNVLTPLVPRRVIAWLVRSRLLRRLYLVPSFVRTLLDFVGGLVHRDFDTRLFAKYYLRYVGKVALVKLGLRRY